MEKALTDIGYWANENMRPALEGFSMSFFTHELGWKAEDVEIFIKKVKQDLDNRAIHGYLPM